MLEKNCKQCGKLFTKKVNVSITNWSKSKYCSRMCSDKNTFLDGSQQPPSSSRKRGRDNNKWKGGPLKIVCKTCSKDFLVDRDRLDAKTCSLKCNALYRKTKEFRVKHSVALRAITPTLHKFTRSFRSLLRTCSRYFMWREECLKRDNYTCQLCTKRGGKLQVDHIKSFIEILIENNIENYEQAIMCDALWDTNNGRTLCLPCHYRTPTFGSKALKMLAKVEKVWR